jgi:hypothetical protein
MCLSQRLPFYAWRLDWARWLAAVVSSTDERPDITPPPEALARRISQYHLNGGRGCEHVRYRDVETENNPTADRAGEFDLAVMRFDNIFCD